MDADNTGDAYSRITSFGYGYEVPDVLHPVRHISEPWDDVLRKYVFEFALHVNIDGDSNERIDRQRNEIKTYAPSPENMKASYGETQTYRWKFRIDAGIIASSEFCHLHQIKAGDGPDASSPLMTLTPRAGSPDKLELIFTAPTGAPGGGKLATVNLGPFRGTWVEAYERIKYTDNGTYSIVVKRVADDSVILSYSSNNIAMWRSGTTFIRPKYGIYRSLGDSLSLVPKLRDEYVRFADLYLAEGDSIILPEAPGLLRASGTASGKISLTWTDNSKNESLFRIDRSSDGSAWSYRATVKTGQAVYLDTGLTASALYYYRVRAENVFGNSEYSSASGAKAEAPTEVLGKGKIPLDLELESYPNPFNPSTEIRYALAKSGHVRLAVYDINGHELELLVDEVQNEGTHTCTWNAASVRGKSISSGAYLVRATNGNATKTIKLILIK